MTWIMWNLILVRLETVLVSLQDRCMVLRQTYHRHRKSFWTHLMALLGSRLKWKLILVRLEIVLILTQDSCTVWAKRTMTLETILDVADGTPK
jgi:hypothetical protein